MTPTARIHRIIADLSPMWPHLVTADATLASLALDSLDFIEIAVGLEDEFDVQIDMDEVEACTTVADIVAMVERKLLTARAA